MDFVYEDYHKSELLKQYSHVVLKEDSFYLPLPPFFDAKKKVMPTIFRLFRAKTTYI